MGHFFSNVLLFALEFELITINRTIGGEMNDHKFAHKSIMFCFACIKDKTMLNIMA